MSDPTSTTTTTTTTTAQDDGDEEFTFTVAAASIPAPATLSQLTNAVRLNTRTLRNRLHSIALDSAFVGTVADAYGLPLLANLRAGDWYVPRGWRGQPTVYFKSTDGHAGAWAFSQRRLNLQLLDVVAARGGAVVVDATRRGKRFPDALAKTVPIWIAVINRLLFPGGGDTTTAAAAEELHTTPLAVAPSERAAIERRLDAWVADARTTLAGRRPPLPPLRWPLRPIFVSPLSPLPEAPPAFDGFHPLVLVTASRVVAGAGVEGEYIQGAGDDHEGWAGSSGLTPDVFWGAWHDRILAAAEDSIDDVVAAAVAAAVPVEAAVEAALIAPTTCVYIAPSSAKLPMPPGGGGGGGGGLLVDCRETLSPPIAVAVTDAVHVPIPAGKRGNKALRTLVPPLLPLFRRTLAAGRCLTFVCDSGDDVAAAVAAVCLCTFFDGAGTYPLPSNERTKGLTTAGRKLHGCRTPEGRRRQGAGQTAAGMDLCGAADGESCAGPAERGELGVDGVGAEVRVCTTNLMSLV